MLTAEAKSTQATSGRIEGELWGTDDFERKIAEAMSVSLMRSLDEQITDPDGYDGRAETARIRNVLSYGRQRPTFRWKLKNFFRALLAGEWFVPVIPGIVKLCRKLRPVPLIGPILAGSAGAVMTGTAELYGTIIHADGSVSKLGLLGRHTITTAGKYFLASAFDNTVEPEIMKYHAFGTGTNAAAIGDTALQTELTTEYAVNSTRPTGSQAHSNATYTTVGTLAPDATVAITEWGLMSQAATGGGTLWDRQVFSAINMISGDTLAVTYVLTIA